MIRNKFQETSISNYTNQELEGLLHILIYRVDVLLASLKLANWGEHDFTRVVEETQAILDEGILYDIGRGMERMIRAYEDVAVAAMTTARYAMLAPGYTQSAEQLQEALASLNEIRRDLPIWILSEQDPQ